MRIIVTKKVKKYLKHLKLSTLKQPAVKKNKVFKPPKKITQEKVLEEQYEALILKEDNLRLKKQKHELEIALLEK